MKNLFLVLACLACGGCAQDSGCDAPFRVQLFKRGDSPEALARGDRIANGDELFLQLEIHHRVYIYVINEDQYGQKLIIYPCYRLDMANLFDPGVAYRLPAPVLGREAFWPVREPTGREQIFVLASPSPIDELDNALSTSAGESCAAPPTAAADSFIDHVTRTIGSCPAEETEFVIVQRAAGIAGSSEKVWLAVHEVVSDSRR